MACKGKIPIISILNKNIPFKKIKKMNKLIILSMIVFGSKMFSQNRMSYSFYSAMNFSRGVELRGEFEDWYISFQGENFIKKQKEFLNWGFAIGLIKYVGSFDVYGGIRVGFMKFEKRNSPSYGIEIETDYFVTEDVFIGLRYAHDSYANSTLTNFKYDSLDRVFIKIGYKF